MLCATLLLTIQDAISKWMTAGFHVGEIMFYRGLFAFAAVLLLSRGTPLLRSRRPGTNALRAVVNLGAGVFMVSAFAVMPLAEALAIAFASPLFVTALAGPMLGERVGWRRWSAVLVGFAGVLLMTDPFGTQGTGFDLVVLLPLAVAGLIAMRDLLTRSLGAVDGPGTILFYTLAASVAGGAVIMAVEGAHLPGAADTALFAVSGLLNGVAHYLAIRAFQLAEAATISPLRYLSLVFATAIGFVVWGDVPSVMGMAGAAVVVASGLYILHRETQLRRRAG